MGQLAGFRFKLAEAAESAESKAMAAAAQKALALEYEARAARLHASGNGDMALGSEGIVRWLGDPVAHLTSGDNILRPRIVLLADEQLTGPARDHVAARIERYVNHQIATILKPLDDLSRDEELEGIAKGLAFQLVENLGVLFRRDVADEVKSLDQTARGAMRKLGVRFGAYHIFMPALLKPAPAELITLLWALHNDAMDKPGYGDLIPALAAGRTSIVTDNSFERNFYKLAGFRFLGKRAVRIDILERLADLIRPLLQWKPESGERPEGAYDGRRFVTTPAMLSILGATADDIEEILKGLGYRADSVSAEEAAAFMAEHDAKFAPAKPEGESSEEKAEAPAETPAAETPAADAAQAAEPATAAEATDPADMFAPAEDEEPKPVLLWRPGGRNDNQQQRQGNRRQGPGGENRDNRGRGKPPHKGKGGGKGAPNKGGTRKDNNRPPQRKEKPIDPDSPFAKLAALKDQLKK